MINTTKCLLLVILILGVTQGQRNNRNNKNNNNKFKGGGRFIPGKTQLNTGGSSSNPRARRPTLGDVLRANGNRPTNRRRQGGGGGGGGNVDHGNPDEVNRMNYLNNLRNNNKANNNNFNSNSQEGNQASHPNIGKVSPPLRRAPGEKPPFAPSWTHCVISIQVSIAWVVVKSPHYPNKFQGQVQCSWIATAAEGYRVRLSFKDLDLLVPNGNGCGSQFVEVIDMTLEKSQARFCGSDIPGDYVSEGNKLRLDLQADAISTPYRGFMAAFRADKEIPGRRETSYFAFGPPELMYNPLTDAPPSNPQFPKPKPNRPRPRPTQRPAPVPTIPGQRIYGRKEQPRFNQPEKTEEDDALESSTTHLYIIIAVIVVILFSAAAAYIFKRYFYKQFKVWWKQRKGRQNEIEMEMQESAYGSKKPLPGVMPLPPTPSYGSTAELLRRQSVSFNGGNYPVNLDYPHTSGMYPQQMGPPSYPGQFGNLHRSHSLGDISQHSWMENRGEPIYEDDAMSVHSVTSIRSANRHPDHEKYKQQKLLERQNSLRMRRNSYDGSGAGMFTPQPQMYPINNPYSANSMYSDLRGFNGYHPSNEHPYGSLPPTLGPGANGVYGSNSGYGMTSQPQQQLYTSSMTDLTAVNHNDFMMQQYNGRSASVYDLTSMPQQEMPSQWSTQLNQRHSSLTSSTNNSTSTNPILKKTNPQPQNELAFSALRAAKSMNDLTAINTKLNECVSWTLPSQRRKSIMDIPHEY